MKVLSSLAVFILVAANVVSAQVKADDICGIWLTEDSRGKMLIYKDGTTYSIKVVWQKNSKDANGKEKVDSKNPNVALRSRTLQNMVIATGLKFDSKEQGWTGGAVYNPEDGNMYSCKAKLDGKSILRFRGYLWVSLLGKTTTWYRTTTY